MFAGQFIILCKVRQYLFRQRFYIHNYLNYANINWAKSHKTKFKKRVSLQKQACRHIFYKPKNTNSQSLLKQPIALNYFKINVYQTIIYV